MDGSLCLTKTVTTAWGYPWSLGWHLLTTKRVLCSVMTSMGFKSARLYVLCSTTTYLGLKSARQYVFFFILFFTFPFTLLGVEGDTSSCSVRFWWRPVLSFYVLVKFL
ncbi:hypothetical protein BsWGS_13034 [Bradybaena similaris]